MKVSIKVTSDFICPWCRIADARLEKARQSLPEDVAVEVDWLPIELNPGMPREGMDRVAYRRAKFGSWEYSHQLDEHTVEKGKTDDVTFNYPAIQRVPNTFAAHRLTLFAPTGMARSLLVKRLFQAYFEEGRDIGDPEVLAEVAGECGIDKEAARHYLFSTAGEVEVIQLEDLARQGDINSVPTFDIAGIRLTGAVPADQLRYYIMDAYRDLLKGGGARCQGDKRLP